MHWFINLFSFSYSISSFSTVNWFIYIITILLCSPALFSHSSVLLSYTPFPLWSFWVACIRGILSPQTKSVLTISVQVSSPLRPWWMTDYSHFLSRIFSPWCRKWISWNHPPTVLGGLLPLQLIHPPNWTISRWPFSYCWIHPNLKLPC